MYTFMYTHIISTHRMCTIAVIAFVGGAPEAYGSHPVCVHLYVFCTCFSATDNM